MSISILKLNPAINPPKKHPNGIVESPAIIPLDKYFSSSLFIIPIATGIVKERVAPIVAARNNPPKNPASCERASSMLREYPPISLAKIVPANIAGSAPINLYSGVITGFKAEAINGERDIIPSIASERVPIAIIPSSNFFP